MNKDKNNKFMDYAYAQIDQYIMSVIIAMIGVFFGLLPYFLIYKLLIEILNKGDQQILIQYCIYILLSFSLQIIMHSISTAISHKTAFHILKEIRLTIMEKIIKLPLGFTQQKGSGYFHNLLVDSMERLEYPLAHAIPETTSNVLMPIGIITIIFYKDWRLGLSLLIPTIITFALYLPMYVGIMNQFANTYYKALETMNGRIIEYIRGNKEVKIFGTEEIAYSRYEESIDYYKDSTLKLYNRMFFVMSPPLVILSSLFIPVLIVGGYLYTSHSISASLYLFTILLSFGIGNSLLKFTEFMDNFYHIKNGARLINELLSQEELYEPINNEFKIMNHEIKMKNVDFSYEIVKVLKQVTLTFPENKKTAIVGPSGSGKSTIANLLARYWDVDNGIIELGGLNYKEMTLAQLMNHINYVSQEPFLFNMSIMDNIRIGNMNATNEEIIHVAKMTHCHSFIEQLEDQYDTVVGNQGIKLSGGQRQMITIR